ncbi:hypothetical protein PHYPSEUDO_013545 [Phytophthora pseudosyringae]|uniref:Uncharacterized protein n=1 Tax=Phytophthora pseudosyringae TaxID=221518 RepID=A0A8T1W6S3_9STRA|nr:hypothetical protein PHYPSEUDO_013545 [Phytophthora pseudosyringae]
MAAKAPLQLGKFGGESFVAEFRLYRFERQQEAKRFVRRDEVAPGSETPLVSAECGGPARILIRLGDHRTARSVLLNPLADAVQGPVTSLLRPEARCRGG